MEFQNLKQLFQKFHNEEVCREYLEMQRWNGKPVCTHCGHSDKIYRIEGGKRYKCGNKNCRKKFSVIVGTIFENTNVPLSTWFAAIYLITAHKKGISSLQLHRDLGVTQKTAWFMLHRIREMLRNDAPSMMRNVVEVDETYVGGREANKHQAKRRRGEKKTTGRSLQTKTAVLGMVERGGEVRAQVINSTGTIALMRVVKKNIQVGTHIVTDNYYGYHFLKKSHTYYHSSVDHSKGQYVNGVYHTNTIEGFFSLFKRGVIGIYHQISKKHTNHYCTEFAFRYNTRDMTDPMRFDFAVPGAIGKRLTFKRLTA